MIFQTTAWEASRRIVMERRYAQYAGADIPSGSIGYCCCVREVGTGTLGAAVGTTDADEVAEDLGAKRDCTAAEMGWKSRDEPLSEPV